jgi:quercetin dioxygenase-like cupin family protein
MNDDKQGDGGTGEERISFLGAELPPGFELELVSVEPGATRPYRDADWWDSLVVVEHGQVELECVRGGRRRFVEGAVMWLAGLPLVALHNPGPEPVLLAAVSRKRTGPMNSRPSPGLN